MPGDASTQNNSTPQLPLPTKAGEVFVIDDFNNKVTRSDLGFNYFGGNTGATESQSGITTDSWSQDSNGTPGGSLQISFDFTGQPDTSFAGYFLSLLGLTDTKVSFDDSGDEPPNSTPFPNYFLDTQDIYRDFLPLPDRSVELLQFDARLVAGGTLKLKIELKDENGSFAFTRHEITATDWQTISLNIPNDFNPAANNQPFDWRRLSVLSFIVERSNNVVNPITGSFRIDNIRLRDVDGEYPNLDAAQDSEGNLAPQFRDAFLDHVRRTSSLYFLDFASTDMRAGGIIQDRSTFADLLSVGGAGFQLTIYVIGAEREYITRENAAKRTRAVLKALHDAPQGPDPVGNAGHKGFFYHFLGIDGRRRQNFDFTGTPLQNESRKTVELSIIDTALVVAGALTARQYFHGSDPTEVEIRTLADAIYERVDWPFMLNTGPRCERNPVKCDQFYLGWKPNETREGAAFEISDESQQGQYSGTIFDPATLDVYTDESVLVSLLAVASPTHPVPSSVFFKTKRDKREGTFFRTFPGSLFTYQFASVWLDTMALGSDHDPANVAPPINYFNNTKDATIATRQYTIGNEFDRATWRNGNGALLWGLSATEGPFDDYFSEAAHTAALDTFGECAGSFGQFSLEAEVGTGGGTIMQRGAASGEMTVLLLPGQSRTFSFDLDQLTRYEFAFRYSNDGAPDNISVSIDGNLPGPFLTQNTRPAAGLPGSGWNVFASSGAVGLDEIPAGQHQLTISVTGDDPFGVEIDVAVLTPQRRLEVGTTTVYGAGSAITHTPAEAIASLWMSQTLDLLHPRFGFADAFNQDVADAVVPGCVDPEEARILRTSGPWANFNGFGIDHGPMAVMIDNFLHQNFVPKLFMSHLRVKQALTQIFPSTFQFSAASVNVGEDAGHIDITVQRTNNVSGAATVHYATTGGTASDRADYTTAVGTLRFSDGEVSKTISILLTNDAFVEGNETINVVLTDPQGGPALGNPSVAVITIVDNDTTQPTSNPIDDAGVFVRQHYHDFLNREPDTPGLNFWTNEITSCGPDVQCREIKRINVSAAFFLSIEFQNTGYLVYRLHKAAYGDATSPNVPGTVPVIRLLEFLPDTQMIGQGIVVGQGNWEQQLESNKNAYVSEFVFRQRFLTEFPTSMTPAQFVDKLRQNTGSALSQAERDQLVLELTANNTNVGRASVLRKVAEDEDLQRNEFNRAFVLIQYYGYLRRNPDDPQDMDFRGWKFWLDKLNQFGGNFINAEMVKAFIASIEYRQRFGP